MRVIYTTLGIFFVLAAIYIVSPVRTVYDSRWAIHTTMSLIDRAGGSLSAYQSVIDRDDAYAIEYVNGEPRSVFPIGVSLLSVPAVAVVSLVAPGFKAKLHEQIPYSLDKTLAAIYGAIAGTIFFWVIFCRFHKFWVALATTAIFALCTSMWSSATRGLWQHGPLVLMLVVTMLLCQRARTRPSVVQYAGLPLAFAYVIRPTASIPIAILSIFIFLKYRRWFLRYVGWALVVGTPWVLFNVAIYGNILSPYYLGLSYGGEVQFFNALMGNLFSPARGLLVYSPILALAFSGFVFALGHPEERALHLAYGTIVVASLMAMSFVPAWWAGHSFGPRYMTDVVPFFTYFVAFNFEPVIACKRRRALMVGIASLAVISLLIHMQGALRTAPLLWNTSPENIDRDPSRVWDWRDPPFFRTRSSHPDLTILTGVS
jgi:hypothetical protein